MKTPQPRNFHITLDNWSHEKLILRRCEEQRHTSLKRWGTFTSVPLDPLLWEPSIPRLVTTPWDWTAVLGEQVYWCLNCVRTGQCSRSMSLVLCGALSTNGRIWKDYFMSVYLKRWLVSKAEAGIGEIQGSPVGISWWREALKKRVGSWSWQGSLW